MTTEVQADQTTDRDLIFNRIIDAPRQKVFRAWTDPDLLKQWFAPLPFTTPVAELEVRPGGANLIVMRGRCQADWRHAVPKQSVPAGPRISVNFQSTFQMTPATTGGNS